MAAIYGTLPKNQMGNMHRSQDREPSPWEFGTSVNQEVSLPGFDYTSLCVSLRYIMSTIICVSSPHFPALVNSIVYPPGLMHDAHRLACLPRIPIPHTKSPHRKSSILILPHRRSLMVFHQCATIPQRQKSVDRDMQVVNIANQGQVQV